MALQLVLGAPIQGNHIFSMRRQVIGLCDIKINKNSVCGEK